MTGAEIEGSGSPWTSAEIDEYERLSEQHGSLTARLADLAGAVTDALPAVRQAVDAAAGPPAED